MTNKEIYELLNKNGYSEQDINQILKAKEEGYEIYNLNIKIPTNKIRDFRTFLKENIEIGLDPGQLREILLGWMKNLNVLEYCNKNYSKEEMSLLRKALENKKDINILKKYGKDVKSMLEISKAIGFKCNEDFFKKYTIEQIKLFNNYQAKKIDISKLLEQGYDDRQIEYLTNFEKKHKNISTYFTKDFPWTTIMHLGYLLDKYSYEQIKPLFQPRASFRFCDAFTELINNDIKDWEKYADANNEKKSLLIAYLLKNSEPKELVENIFNSNFEKCEYEKMYSLYHKKCSLEKGNIISNSLDDIINGYTTTSKPKTNIIEINKDR